MERIVVGVDGSEGAQHALRWALAEARMRQSAVEVVYGWHVPYLMATPYSPPIPYEPMDFEPEARALLDQAVDAEDTDGLEVRRVLVCGPAANSLLETAKGADLLVVGSRGRGGFAGLLLGSVSQTVIHHAPCPIVVIPSSWPSQ